MSRRRTPYVGLALGAVVVVGALIAQWSPHGAVAFVIAIAVAVVVFALVLAASGDRTIARLRAALERGEAIALDGVSPARVHDAADLLARHEKWRELADWLDRFPSKSWLILQWRVTARLALGEVSEARAALAAAPAPADATDRELAAQLRARVALAEGELEPLDAEALPGSAPALRYGRLLTRADGLTLAGDADGARAILAELRTALGDGAIDRIRAAKRPSAALL